MSRMLGLAVVVGTLGCGSSGTVVSASAPRAKPGHVRLVNLSTSGIEARVDRTYTVAGLAPGDMSPAFAVSSGRSHIVTVTRGGRTSNFKAAVAAGKFSTVIVSDKDIEGFVSGNSLTDRAHFVVDFVNLTGRPLTYSGPSLPATHVPAHFSVSINAPVASISVSVGPGAATSAEGGNAQITAIYAFEQGGHLKLRSRSLKGTGAPVMSGGASRA